MNPRRFANVAAALCGTVVLAGWVVAWPVGFGSAGIESTGAAPIEDRRAPSLAADAELANALQATAMGNAAVANANVVTAAEPVGRPPTRRRPPDRAGIDRRGRVARFVADAAVRNTARAGGDSEHA